MKERTIDSPLRTLSAHAATALITLALGRCPLHRSVSGPEQSLAYPAARHRYELVDFAHNQQLRVTRQQPEESDSVSTSPPRCDVRDCGPRAAQYGHAHQVTITAFISRRPSFRP